MRLDIANARSVFSMFLRVGGGVLVLAHLGACGSASGSRSSAGGVTQRGAYKVGTPYKIDGVLYTPKEEFNRVESGVASWYGPGFHGKSTANGERYDQSDRTAAHRTLQMPSVVRVTNTANGLSTVVRINDRGPYASNRVIDLSRTNGATSSGRQSCTLPTQMTRWPTPSSCSHSARLSNVRRTR